MDAMTCQVTNYFEKFDLGALIMVGDVERRILGKEYPIPGEGFLLGYSFANRGDLSLGNCLGGYEYIVKELTDDARKKMIDMAVEVTFGPLPWRLLEPMEKTLQREIQWATP